MHFIFRKNMYIYRYICICMFYNYVIYLFLCVTTKAYILIQQQNSIILFYFVFFITDSLITEAKEDDTSNAGELIGTRNTNPPDAVCGTTIKDSIDKWSSGNKDCKTLMETEGILKDSNSIKLYGTLHDFACQPCTGAMLIFFVSFQFWYIYVLLNQVPILCYYVFAFVNCTYLTGGVELSVEQIGKAQKFIKWAGSALNYDDVPTTVLNLRKALHLLTTGQELE